MADSEGEKAGTFPVVPADLSRDTREQWVRVVICMTRLERWEEDFSNQIAQADDGTVDTRMPPEFLLDVSSFLLHAHALSDYLKVFDDVDVINEVKADQALALCRDLVIHLKHGRMERRPFTPGGDTAQPTTITRMNVTLRTNDDPVGLEHVHTGPGYRVETEADPRSVGAVALAKECLAAWVRLGFPSDVSY